MYFLKQIKKILNYPIKQVLNVLQVCHGKHKHLHRGVSLRIQPKCGKMRIRITSNTDTFHIVWVSWYWPHHPHYHFSETKPRNFFATIGSAEALWMSNLRKRFTGSQKIFCIKMFYLLIKKGKSPIFFFCLFILTLAWKITSFRQIYVLSKRFLFKWCSLNDAFEI